MCILRPLYAERYQSCQCICALPGDGERGAGEEGRGGGWDREKERERLREGGREREGEGGGGREGGRERGGGEREGEAGRGREKGMVGLDHRCAFPRPHIAPPPGTRQAPFTALPPPWGRLGASATPKGNGPEKALTECPRHWPFHQGFYYFRDRPDKTLP